MTKKNWILPAAAMAAVLALSSCPASVEYETQDQTVMYNITVFPVPEHGRIAFSQTRAQPGSVVKIYVLPDPGYVIGDMSYVNKGKTGEGSITITDNINYYRTLPVGNYHIDVTATFVPNTKAGEYTVSVDRGIKNGLIVPETSLSPNGAQIKLYLNPQSGYVLKAGSLEVRNPATDQKIPGVDVSDATFPPEFTMPGQNVIISAEFEAADFAGLLDNAEKTLRASMFDTAADYYAEAYGKRSGQNAGDVNEVIFYHSIAKLGSILLDRQVRELLGTGKGRLHFQIIPLSLDDWVCDSDNGWPGTDDNKWFRKWRGVDYNINDKGYPLINDDDPDPDKKEFKGYAIEGGPPLWRADPLLKTDNMSAPKIEVRVGVDRGDNDPNSGGFLGSFGDYEINTGDGNNHRYSRQKFFNIVFWLFMSQNRDQGAINSLLEKIEIRLLGTAFEDAAKIAETLPANARVPLYPNLKNRFGLEKYYGSGDTFVGKAELDYIFGTLRALKAAIQFLRAYDWTIDLRPWLVSGIFPEDGLDQFLNTAFVKSQTNGGVEIAQAYWSTSGSRSNILPVRNRFMTIRLAGNLATARNELSKAVGMIDSAMVYWHGSSAAGGSVFSAQGKTDYKWAKDGIGVAKTAMDGTGNFYFPKKLPKPGGVWPATQAAADYAVDPGRFFTSDVFNPRNLLTIERSTAGQNVPSMYKIPWYQDGTNAVLLPGRAVRLTAPIPDRFMDDYDFEIVEGHGTDYMLYSFEINTENLRLIFPKGFEQTKYTGRDDKTAFFYEVFPTIPLWPERPTYLSGPGNGQNLSASQLYKYYHDL